jgi:hypothetical protein
MLGAAPGLAGAFGHDIEAALETQVILDGSSSM